MLRARRRQNSRLFPVAMDDESLDQTRRQRETLQRRRRRRRWRRRWRQNTSEARRNGEATRPATFKATKRARTLDTRSPRGQNTGGESSRDIRRRRRLQFIVSSGRGGDNARRRLETRARALFRLLKSSICALCESTPNTQEAPAFCSRRLTFKADIHAPA